jgi:hypothetical protein
LSSDIDFPFNGSDGIADVASPREEIGSMMNQSRQSWRPARFILSPGDRPDSSSSGKAYPRHDMLNPGSPRTIFSQNYRGRIAAVAFIVKQISAQKITVVYAQ